MLLHKFYPVLFWAAALTLTGCGADSGPAPPPTALTVLAAASTGDAMQEIASQFQEASGVTVHVSPGPSNNLAQQIIAGAPADVFLSANETWAAEVAKADLAAETVTLLAGELVLVVPSGNPAGIQSAADLLSERVKHVALAGENVPAGMYAEQALSHLKLLEPLKESSKIVRGQSVRVALSYVERGEAEAGIVYATDTHGNHRVQTILTFPAESHEPICYYAVRIGGEGSPPAAQAFFDFLRGPDAAIVFRKFGFVPLAVGEP